MTQNTAKIELQFRARLIAGNCPECGQVLAIANHGEPWPMFECPCGWEGDTHSVMNKVRLERVSPVADWQGAVAR